MEMVNTLQETGLYGLRLMAADWRGDLRTPGLLHMVDSQMDGENRADILECKLAQSNFGTLVDGTRGILLRLSVPADLKKEELKYLCEHIPDRADPDVNMRLSLTVNPSPASPIRAQLLATDAYTTHECPEDF